MKILVLTEEQRKMVVRRLACWGTVLTAASKGFIDPEGFGVDDEKALRLMFEAEKLATAR